MNLSSSLEQYITGHMMPEEDFLRELNRETHLSCVYSRMLSGHIQGKILYMLCRMLKPERILEIGTFTGYSAISMALALPENGHLHTIEINDEMEAMVKKYIAKAGLEQKISLHIGDAIEIIPTINETFDLVFIDGNKRNYAEYFELSLSKVRNGGFLIADNTLWDGKVVEELQPNDTQTQSIIEFNALINVDSRVEVVIFPFRDGMTVMRKK